MVDDEIVDVEVRYGVEEEECLPSFVLCVTDEASIVVGPFEGCLVFVVSDVDCKEEWIVGDSEFNVAISFIDEVFNLVVRIEVDEQFNDCDTDDAPIDVGFVYVSLESDDVAEEKLFIELEVVLPLEKQFVDNVQLEVVISLVDDGIVTVTVFVAKSDVAIVEQRFVDCVTDVALKDDDDVDELFEDTDGCKLANSDSVEYAVGTDFEDGDKATYRQENKLVDR